MEGIRNPVARSRFVVGSVALGNHSNGTFLNLKTASLPVTLLPGTISASLKLIFQSGHSPSQAVVVIFLLTQFPLASSSTSPDVTKNPGSTCPFTSANVPVFVSKL